MEWVFSRKNWGAGGENTKSTKDKRESCGCQSFNSPQNTKKILRVKHIKHHG